MNNYNYKKNRDLSKGEIIKDKTRKIDKSIGNKNKNYNQSKSKGKNNNLNNSNLNINLNKNENQSKNKKRSKSLVKPKGKITIKNYKNEEKGDIESILYGEAMPDDNEDPFDDVDSVVRAMNFNNILLFSKNIFSVEFNEKYKKYSEKFDDIFNKIIMANNQRKSVNNNEKNENNLSNAQSEKTTDSFKKNKINVSFIDNNQH